VILRTALSALASAAALAVVGCGDDVPHFDYPRDGELRLDQVQAKGTHNSYHIAPDPFQLADWNYTHSPLGEQLGEHGIRQFELDININVFDDRFEVFHILRIDEGTTCFLLVDCFRDLERWSDRNRAHHPIVVMVELKDGFDASYAEHFFDLFEEELLSVWPQDRLITPDFVRGDYATVREALADRGWPTLGEVRGRALFFFLDSGEHRDFYTHGDTSLDGRLAFVTASSEKPYGAITSLDDPIGSAVAIDTEVAAGMLVRTRVDTLGDEGPEVDPDRLDAALSSGAQFLSTDIEDLELPGGAPSRCNPVTAPEDCTATDIENPEFLD